MLASAVSQPAVKVLSNHGFGMVVENPQTGQKAFFSAKSFRAGDVVSRFSSGGESENPNYLTVQIGERRHIKLEPDFLQYINHSCDPNVFFDTACFELRALRDIEDNEELAFFYPSSEWEMDQSFSCHCGSDRCLGDIRGAKFIPREIIGKYELTMFIAEKLDSDK